MVAIWAAFTSSVQDPDYWWHYRVGRWMLDNGRLPSTDLFTYTATGHAWIDHEYLSEVLIALLQGWGGLAAVSLFFGALTWAGFWLIYKTAGAGRRPYVIAGLGIALAALAGAPIWGPRAQMITFFFACLELYWLRGYLQGRSRAINWLPLAVALWANFHGGFLVAYVFLGVAIAAEAVGWVLDRRDAAHLMRLRTLGRVLGLSLLAALATPHFYRVFLNPLETLSSATQRRLIVEWFSPDFHLTVLLPLLAAILLLFLAFALRRPAAYDLFLALAALALSLESVRNLVLFIAAVTPILIESLSATWREESERRGWRLPGATPAPLFAALTALALVVIAGASGYRIATALAHQDADTRASYPVAAGDWLRAHPEVGTRMYNQYGWGGYLADRFYPDASRRVFIFGEATLMGDRLLQQYQDVQTLRRNWVQVLDDYQVDYVVYNRDEALANVLATEPNWQRVYQDDVAVIYVRKT
ncbi:MAG: hypothetical protein E6I70_04310 [Chloroflexi bacterium]|nr:MAG: hypothetical protein E6I70_04310 [Chloroflexota bacterium]